MKLYRVAVNQDPGSISRFDLDEYNKDRRWPITAESTITLATQYASRRTYYSMSDVKGAMTRLKRRYPLVSISVEESEPIWTPVEKV